MHQNTYAVQDTIWLDDLSVIPSSIKILNHTCSDYAIYSTHQIVLNDCKEDSIGIQYACFQMDIEKVFEDTLFSKVPKNKAIPYAFQIYDQTSDIIEEDEVNYDGSLSRGISVGNARDLALNSNLNLSINGKIADDIEINATINDQNIPFQPEGNTAQIQDFDQVFIELKKGNQQVKLGDVFLQNPNSDESYFMRYNRKGQGIQYGKKTEAESHEYGFMISKGKYNRYAMEVIEGNQGPYKLTGLNGERFIIILAGTERVFIDGQQLKRGEGNDYVIDYNLGEISFTANRLITKDLRIQIEFEYAEQNYLRSIFTGNSQFKYEDWTYGFNFFRDNDHKNQPILSDYDPEQLSTLRSVGDDLSAAQVMNFDSVPYEIGMIRYKMVDTSYLDPGNGQRRYDTVFIHSTHPDSAFYQVGFSFVGMNQGEYVIKEELAGGKIYEWVGVINGVPQGDHVPYVQLIAAKKREMYGLNASRPIGEHGRIYVQSAMSNNDINSFSSADGEDNLGYAGRLRYEYLNKVNNKWELKSNLAYEMTTEHFRSIERFRKVEFKRDWNLDSEDIALNLLSYEAKLQAEKTKYAYGVDVLSVSEENNGYKQNYYLDKQYGQFDLKINGNYLIQQGQNEGAFNRPTAKLTWNSKKAFDIYTQWNREDNQVKSGDSLDNRSFKFDERIVGLKTEDTVRFQTSLQLRERKDYNARFDSLDLLTQSFNYEFIESWRINEKNKLNLNFQYRLMEVFQENSPYQRDSSILTRLEYFGRLFNNSLKTNLFYEVSSGLERKREFRYVEVNPNQGIYVWDDLNGNGLQELNEFLISEDNLAQNNYIRIFTLGTDFISTQNLSFTENISFDPKQLFKGKYSNESLPYKIARIFQLQSNYRIQKKFVPQEGWDNYNIFNTLTDDLVISNNISGRNQLFLFRSNSRFGIQYSNIVNQQKQFLSSGFEVRDLDRNLLNFRLKIMSNSTMNVEVMEGKKSSLNQNLDFQDNNYSLTLRELKPSYQWVYQNRFRFKMAYRYNEKINDTIYTTDSAYLHEFSFESRYFKSKQGNISARLSYVNLTYDGSQNTSVAYAILEGLQSGNNIVWNVSLERMMKNDLQLTLSYDGRKSEESRMIHLGSVTLRYLF